MINENIKHDVLIRKDRIGIMPIGALMIVAVIPLLAVFSPVLLYFCGTAYRADHTTMPSNLPKMFKTFFF